MNGINKVILLGTLGADPEVSHLKSGLCVASISVATSRKVKDKSNDQFSKVTEWTRVIFFGRLAEICAEYCKKASKVYVSGRLSTRKYFDEKINADRYITEVVADELQVVAGSRDPVSKDQALAEVGAMTFDGDDALDRAFDHASKHVAQSPSLSDDDIPF